MNNRESTLQKLRQRIGNGQPVLIASAGNGIVAKSLEESDLDLISVSSESRFAMMGFGRSASHFPMGSATAIAIEYGMGEILPIVQTPVAIGVAASDPSWHHEELLRRIKSAGFAAVQNLPTVAALGDGHYRDMIDDSGYTFQRESELLARAAAHDLVSIGYGVRQDEIERLADVKTDVICIHLGLSAGRSRIAARSSLKLSRDDAARHFDKMSKAIASRHPGAIVLGDGGPVATPDDLQFILNNTSISGYVLGLQIENVAVESGVTELAREFKRIPIPWITTSNQPG